MTLYLLARPDLKIPMPDRGNRLFGEGGETVNEADPYYRRLIADRDIVAAEPPKAAKPRRKRK